MANPDPEISYPDAVSTRDDVIMATGRSDFPNQVNNVLGFPFIFRGALDVQATKINEEMKLAAAYALAELAREEVPDDVKRAYGDMNLRYGPEYIIPKPFDSRALLKVACAVAQAAMDSGDARKTIADMNQYRNQLEQILGRERAVMRKVLTKASRGPKRIVFAEGDHPKIIRAAHICIEEGIALPILLGNVSEIQQLAQEIDISLDGITVIDPAKTDKEKFQHYVDVFSTRRCRQGVTRTTARRAMQSRNYFAAMMVEMGDADGFLSGMALSYPETIRPALEVIGPRPDINRVAGAYLVILDDGVKVFADTTVNIDPRAEDLVEIAIETARMLVGSTLIRRLRC